MTSVLRDSLGGNCKTIMVATISAEAAQTAKDNAVFEANNPEFCENFKADAEKRRAAELAQDRRRARDLAGPRDAHSSGHCVEADKLWGSQQSL